MESGLISMIISLVSGAVGGNVAGGLMKNLSLGTVGNSILGILGGGLGGVVLTQLGLGGVASAGGGMDIGSILSTVAASGVGGGGLIAVVGAVKNMLGK